MKERYDEKYKNNMGDLPKVGERVYMRIKTEKGSSENPKLAIDLRGPYRVIETSNTTAKIRGIQDEKEERTVQFDLLRKVPIEVDNTIIETKTGKHKKTGKKSKESTELKINSCSSTETVEKHQENGMKNIVLKRDSPLHPLGICYECKREGTKVKELLGEKVREGIGEWTAETLYQVYEAIKMNRLGATPPFLMATKRVELKHKKLDDDFLESLQYCCNHRVRILQQMTAGKNRIRRSRSIRSTYWRETDGNEPETAVRLTNATMQQLRSGPFLMGNGSTAAALQPRHVHYGDRLFTSDGVTGRARTRSYGGFHKT